jgi:hypothetical protein
MSKQEWEGIYRAAWDIYYTPEHMQTILRRAGAYDVGISHLTGMLSMFSKSVAIEKVHPLQGGLFRRKHRLDRRYGMPIEPVWAFYPKYTWEIVSKHARMAWQWFTIDRMRRRVRNDPNRHSYTDAALTPVADDETETLELFTHNEGARNEVVRTRKIHDLTHGTGHTLADA